MKAVTLNAFGSVDNFILEEVAIPATHDNNVLVKIKATAFNPIDYQIRQGSTESKLLKSPILGRECSGIVTAVGKQVANFSVGDEIVAYVGSLGSNGTYAEYVSIPQSLIAHKPRTISFEEAASIPMGGLTALQCYERLNISSEHTLFISGGAGGVGTMLIKLLLAAGINHFITTAGNSESNAHLQQLGVKEEQILNYKSSTFLEDVFTLNYSSPFDICIDLVGGKMSEVCSEIIKVNGSYADVTFLTTAKARERLFDMGITIHNISNYAYSISSHAADLIYYGEKLSYLMDLIADKKISPPPIYRVGDLNTETVKLAHTLLETNRTNGMKLVMTFN